MGKGRLAKQHANQKARLKANPNGLPQANQKAKQKVVYEDDLTDEQKIKCEIHRLFYSKQQVVRDGGGKPRNALARNQVDKDELAAMMKKVDDYANVAVTKYFTKMAIRDAKIAPPSFPIQHLYGR